MSKCQETLNITDANDPGKEKECRCKSVNPNNMGVHERYFNELSGVLVFK